MTDNRLWIARCLCVCFALACLSGIVAAQPRMGLVGPGVGWAVLNQGTMVNWNDHLFWTGDDGSNWKDITPNDPASRQIAGVFFLDSSRGWVLLALKREPPKNNQDSDNFITETRGFDVASTADGGATWTIKHLDALPEGVGWMAASEIFFLDAAHGWMNIESPVPHWGGEGALLATIDGGNTWKSIVEVNGAGGYGPIRFTDPQNGWIAGGPGDNYLYATNDSGRHWREVSVPPPPSIPGRVAAQYSLPRFADATHGFLAVKYSGPGKSEEGIDILALLSTKDGGHTWRSESLAELEQESNFPIVAVVDSTALAPRRRSQKAFTLLKLAPGGKVTETSANELAQVAAGAAIVSLNFSDAAHGWASSSDGHFLSTADGGATWKDISPDHGKMSMQAPPSSALRANSSSTTLPSSLVPSAVPGPIAAASTISTYKSRHLGFDACAAPPQNSKSPQMATWWASSPYFDVGIYVGGSTRSCPQPNLNSSWVSAVTSEGWGLIPLWPGPQAPCTCVFVQGGNNTWPNCTKFFGTYINNTSGAYAQGQAEADAATKGSRSAMKTLGLGTGSVIYYDIENYTPSASCPGDPNPIGSYVNSFLSGWVSEIQSNGYIAAVYGNPAPASTWYAGGTGYAAVSPSPSDVFIAKQDNRVTIWGLTTLTDTAWPQDRRIHQYGGPHSETWGALNFPSIDTDIEDADVTGGNGAKSYSFTYTTIDYPGANGTSLNGINNLGQIVGSYGDPATGLYHGFLYTVGSFTNIDFPNASQTEAWGINNAGSIVGFYINQTGTHGFLYQGGNYTGLDYPGAIYTEGFGINDDNQISGYYADSLSVQHGFLYQGGTFTPLDYPGSTGTNAYWINGDAQIAGTAQNGGPGCAIAFLYAQGNFTNPPVECGWGINNNDQITGAIGANYVFEHEGSTINIAVPGASNMVLWSLNDFTLNSQGTAKVALVGNYVLSTGYGHGFLATSQ
ncbi:MAG TPA: glycoside hydrolase domain-containing protein [Candidatus Acidoferrum sp.]